MVWLRARCQVRLTMRERKKKNCICHSSSSRIKSSSRNPVIFPVFVVARPQQLLLIVSRSRQLSLISSFSSPSRAPRAVRKKGKTRVWHYNRERNHLTYRRIIIKFPIIIRIGVDRSESLIASSESAKHFHISPRDVSGKSIELEIPSTRFGFVKGRRKRKREKLNKIRLFSPI